MSSPPLPRRFADSDDYVRVTSDPIDVAAISQAVAAPESGATVVFLGTVRDHAPGRSGITHLEYEAYREVVESKIGAIISEAHARWPLVGVAATHRVGTLSVGEVAVAVAVAAAHRAEAFAAARYLIDELKARAPIWKKEHWPGGAEWVREDEAHRTEPPNP